MIDGKIIFGESIVMFAPQLQMVTLQGLESPVDDCIKEAKGADKVCGEEKGGGVFF